MKTPGLLVLLLFFAMGCHDGLDEEKPTQPGKTEFLEDPGPGNLAGKIIGTIHQQPLVGVHVEVNGKTTKTDSNGTFLLNGVGNGSFRVEISGSQVYTRLVAINTNNGRSMLFDAIEINSSFHLGFYREIARGNHPNEKDIYPTHRWINPMPPTFYIDTDASATLDGVIDNDQIDAVKDVIEKVVPVFSGNTYMSVSIVLKPFSSLNFGRDIPDNSYVISFDDRLIWQLNLYGVAMTDPTFTSGHTNSINKTVIRVLDKMSYYDGNGLTFKEVVAHEMGHGFGFRHTSDSTLLPSVMHKFGEFRGLYSELDRIHMNIVYSRPAGNMDIDTDPIPGDKSAGPIPGKQVFVDRLEITLAADEIARLQALTNKIPADDLSKMLNNTY